MRRPVNVLAACCATLCLACASSGRPSGATNASVDRTPPAGTLAKVYYWRAKAGKLDEYSRYIRDGAEPIDHEAQRAGGFLTVSTYVSHDPDTPWTHMRIFVLRDSAQLAGLSAALDAAGSRVEPDSVKRRVRGQYSATLRDRVGDATLELLR